MITDTTIYMLECQDASHLGGPMGTEYTTHMFSKLFRSVDAAKRWAKDYQKSNWPKWAKWTWHSGSKSSYWVCDARINVWKIIPMEVEN